MPDKAAVQQWLRRNPESNLINAYKAVGYEGPPLKIKVGNLTNNRDKIRLARRGENGDTNRKKAQKLRQPINKTEKSINRLQNTLRTSYRKAGINVVIDHIIDLDLLRTTLEGLDEKEAQALIERLEVSYGPLGDRPQNRRIIDDATNGKKNSERKALQKHLEKLEEIELKRDRGGIRFRAGGLGVIGGVLMDPETIEKAVEGDYNGAAQSALKGEVISQGVQRIGIPAVQAVAKPIVEKFAPIITNGATHIAPILAPLAPVVAPLSLGATIGDLMNKYVPKTSYTSGRGEGRASVND